MSNIDPLPGGPPSVLTALLSEKPPHLPPSASVRQHRMDDAKPAWLQESPKE